MLGKVQFMSRRTYLSTVLSTPMPDHQGCAGSMFLMCLADGVFESHFKSHTKPVITADQREYRIAREEDSVSLKSSLMIVLVLVFMFLLISGWNSMIEPMVLHGQSFKNMFVYLQVVCSWSVQQMGYKTKFTSTGINQFNDKLN